MTTKSDSPDSRAARPELCVPPAAFERQKILVVDDRAENLYALERVLADVDAEIVKATSGNAALAATLDNDFALAILDVEMPGMSGYELVELLRGDQKTQLMPIAFVTASYMDEQHMFKGYETFAKLVQEEEAELREPYAV